MQKSAAFHFMNICVRAQGSDRPISEMMRIYQCGAHRQPVANRAMENDGTKLEDQFLKSAKMVNAMATNLISPMRNTHSGNAEV